MTPKSNGKKNQMMIAINETRPSGEISPISPIYLDNSMEFDTKSESVQVQVEKVPLIQNEDLEQNEAEIEN